MFAFFQSEPTIYSFETSKTFETAIYFLNQLRLKKVKLEKNIPTEDQKSLHYQKYQVISGLIEEFDKEICCFNDNSDKEFASNSADEFALSSKLAAICLRILGSDYELLVKPRNNDRKSADAGLKWGAAGMAVGAATLLPISFAGACVVGGIFISAQIARYLTGTNDPRASSAYLLVELTRSLLGINQNFLTNALNELGLSEDCDEKQVHACYQQLTLTSIEQDIEQKEKLSALKVAYEILIKHTEQKNYRQQTYSSRKRGKSHSH